MTEHTWSPQQAAALDKVGAWLKDPNAPQVFRLFGYAGTGKTTLARHLAMTGARSPLFGAFTGKAASVLRDKGCPGASTLHSLLYKVYDRSQELMLELQAKMNQLGPEHPDYPEARSEYEDEADRVKRPWFHVNPDSIVKDCDVLVVDEVSMVDERIGHDIESFNKKILVLGDPAQLPPVRGGGYFTNVRPDVLLTEIHRQAADNPLLKWATLARQGQIIPYGDLGLAHKLRRDTITDEWLAKAGQILVGKNETRRDLNARMRKQLGHTSIFPVDGDRLVMLVNDHKLGVLNGTLARCLGPSEVDVNDASLLHMNIVYEKQIMQNLKFESCIFKGLDPEQRRRLQADYGYALTVHKAQGSQWPSVVVYDDGFAKREPTNRNRWLYTAITRAEKQLYIVTS